MKKRLNENMKNSTNKIISLFVMVLLILEFIEAGKKEEHIPENEFSHDTFLRSYSTSAASITASSTTNLEAIEMMRDFVHKQ
ncbi:MAG: hypothetical protein C0412_12370 [Flavobacterium sp.]|nr:hypothetical protein [Flavobacterium sp.]